MIGTKTFLVIQSFECIVYESNIELFSHAIFAKEYDNKDNVIYIKISQLRYL